MCWGRRQSQRNWIGIALAVKTAKGICVVSSPEHQIHTSGPARGARGLLKKSSVATTLAF